jgi:hypothetical protein
MPQREISGDVVHIGEADNTAVVKAVVKKEEWNVLADLIRFGRLSRI